MSNKPKVAVKLSEWLKNKLGTTAEYWDTHLTSGGLIRLAKLVRLKKETAKYEKKIKEEYKDELTTISTTKTIHITVEKKRELLEFALGNDFLDGIKIDTKEFEKLGMLKDCKVTHKEQTKVVAINIIEKYLQAKKDEKVDEELAKLTK